MKHRSKHIAKNLVDMATRRGKTITQLADECDVSRQTIHNWQAGRCGATLDHIAALMFMADVDADTDTEVAVLRARVSELEQELEVLETEHTEALLELKGYRNGTTEQEMKAVAMRFAELADDLMNNNKGDDDGDSNSNSKSAQEKNA